MWLARTPSMKTLNSPNLPGTSWVSSTPASRSAAATRAASILLIGQTGQKWMAPFGMALTFWLQPLQDRRG